MLELFLVCGVAVGLGALAWAGLIALQARQAASWPTVTGEVVDSRRSAETVGSVHTGGRSKVVAARIRYRYSVRGRSYEGQRICIGGEFYTSFPERAERMLARYPEGTEVIVHHHPRRPQLACLEPRTEVAWFYAAIGAAVLGMTWVLG